MKTIYLVLITLIFASTGHAQVYKWTDAQGNIHFGDKPPGTVQAEQVTIRVNTYSGGANVEALKAFTNDKVVLYSTQSCGYCKQARRFLNSKRIPFQEYDVETSRRGQRDYEQLNGRGVPIILVGEQRMNGFSEDRLRSLLSTAGYSL